MSISTPAVLASKVESVAGKQPVFAQTMIRVGDYSKSIEFYKSVGLDYLCKMEFPEYKFSLFFLAAKDSSSPEPPSENASREEVSKYLWGLRCPTLELTYNWLSNDPPEKYVSGNEEPRGFGHLAISCVAPPATAAKDSTALPSETASVVTDPDGYSVKLVGGPAPCGAVYSRVMLRVNDPVKSVTFFERLGMQRVGIIHDQDSGISHYFVGYFEGKELSTMDEVAAVASPLVHLQHSWRNPESKLVNGNEKPYRGFGHLGVIVDDIYAVSARMEEFGYKMMRKPSPFLDVGEIAFVADDDVGYWIELIARSNEAADAPYSKN